MNFGKLKCIKLTLAPKSHKALSKLIVPVTHGD